MVQTRGRIVHVAFTQQNSYQYKKVAHYSSKPIHTVIQDKSETSEAKPVLHFSFLGFSNAFPIQERSWNNDLIYLSKCGFTRFEFANLKLDEPVSDTTLSRIMCWYFTPKSCPPVKYTLDLSGNAFKNFNTACYRIGSHLVSLNLSNCSLKIIRSKYFLALNRLRSLNLSYN